MSIAPCKTSSIRTRGALAVEVPDTLLQLFQLTRQGTLLLVKMVPAEFHSTIVKSPHCEPQFFDDWVETNLNVDAPGATSANLKSLGHTVCARPMYPLEADVEFSPKTELFVRV